MKIRDYKYISVFFLSLLIQQVMGQTHFYNKGMSITIPEGMTIHIEGDYNHDEHNGRQPEVVNAGELHLKGDLNNNSTNNVYLSNAGTTIFYGDSAQAINGDSSVYFYGLKVDKGAEELTMMQAIHVNDTLEMIGGNLHMNGYDIELNNTGILSGETNDHRVYGLEGELRATRTLSGNTGNIAGLGLEFESGISLGTTLIERGHSSQAGASTGGILRYFRLFPNSFGETLDNVKLTYLDDNEFNGLEEAKFAIWQSDNNGIVWDPLESNPTGVADQYEAADVTVNENVILFTMAERECAQVPVVDLGADTVYLCETDTIELDAENPGLFYFWSTGENSQAIKVSASGTYDVAVRDANGCVGYDTIEVIQKPFPDLSFSADRVCQNNTSIFVNNSTIDADTMTFHWDFGVAGIDDDTSNVSEPTFLYDTTGVYTVRLSAVSSFNCESAISETYVVHPLPEVDFELENNCFSDTNSFINESTILANLDVLSYSISDYSWDFGEAALTSDTSTQSDPEYLYSETGTFDITLIGTSNAGCTDTSVQSLMIYPRAVVDFEHQDRCAGFDITLSNLTTLASGTMNFEWDFDDGLFSTQENPSKVYLTPGTYNVSLKATTDEGCQDSTSNTVQIFELPTAAFTVQDTCANDQIIISNNSSINGGEPLSFEWGMGDNTTSTDEHPVKTYDADGDYTITLLVTTDNGCVDSTEEEVIIFAVPQVNFEFEPVCEEQEVTFQNFSQISTGGISYTWDFGNGNTSNLKNPVEPYDTAGIYQVHLIGLSSEGCSDELTKELEIYANPTFNLPDEVSTCGSSYVLDAENPGSTYQWSDNSGAQTLTVTSSGTYSVLVTNQNGCQASHATTVSLDATFTPSLGDDVSACVNYILDAGNLGSQSYLWSTGEDTRQILVTQSGTYSVDIVDQNGCPGSDTIEVTINDLPIVELGDDIAFCTGDSAVIDAQNAGSTFSWSTGAVTQTITIKEAGNYSVTVTTPESCSASDQLIVTVFDLPEVDLGDDRDVCDSVTLDAQNEGMSYFWSDGSTEQTFFTDQPGTYWVQVGDANNCSDRDTVTVTISPKPVVNLGDDQELCSGTQTTLDAQNTGETFLWQDGSTEQTLLVSSTGTYHVTVTNGFGCDGHDTVNVSYESQLQVILGDDQVVCLGSGFELDAGNPGSTYEWGSNTGIVADSQQLAVQDSGTYWVLVTTSLGCTGADTVRISISEDTVHAEYLAVSLVDVGDTIQFINLSSPEDVEYLWDFGDGVTSIAEDPLHIYQSAGTFNVSLDVSNEHCVATVVKEIIVEELRSADDGPFFDVSFNEIIDLSAYPNPTDGPFTVNVQLETEGEIYLLLYDENGQRIAMRQVEGQDIDVEMDISHKLSALYFVRVVLDDKMKVVRVMKQ